MGTMHVYGRGGDIVMSMAAASLISGHDGEDPSICVHGDYLEVASVLASMGMPISHVVASPVPPSLSDAAIFGSSISRLSPSMLSELCGTDRGSHYNCCLANIPHGLHVSNMMCYLTGLCGSVGDHEFPHPSDYFRHRGGNRCILYHLGGSRSTKHLYMERPPFPGMNSVFVGGKEDPVMPWCNVDMRGAPLRDLADLMPDMAACVGSDSLVTHLSSLLGVPTVAIHDCHATMATSSRSVYGGHAHSLLAKEGDKNVFEVINLLSRCFDNEL